MVASYILRSQSKLATTRWWHTTTLPEMLGVTDADEDELYDAMDWLLERQGGIEKKLADRHLKGDAMALYDLSSSYFEGVTCPLAALGHNRDGKKGTLQVGYIRISQLMKCADEAVSLRFRRVSQGTQLAGTVRRNIEVTNGQVNHVGEVVQVAISGRPVLDDFDNTIQALTDSIG